MQSINKQVTKRKLRNPIHNPTPEQTKSKCVIATYNVVQKFKIPSGIDLEDDEDLDVDDVDAPNCFPYKKCSVCEERKSCGNYDDNKVWFCEDCFVEEKEEDE